MSHSSSRFRRPARDLLPPRVRRVGRELFGWRWFRGRDATLAVQARRATYECDVVLFAEPWADEALLHVAAARGDPHAVLLASGVVPYLPELHAFLDELVGRGLDWLGFHNLPLHDGEPDTVCVEIYDATYQVRFFNREKFLAHFAERYEVVRSYASVEVRPVGWSEYPSTGLLLRRKGLK